MPVLIRIRLSTLRSRIVISVVAVMLVLVVGMFFVFRRYWFTAQDELTQQRSWGLAKLIAGDLAPALFPVVDETAIARVIHSYVSFNPGLDVHLLDMDGSVLRTFAKVECTGAYPVDMQPVRRFFEAADGAALPIVGTDPCNGESNIVFSAAPIDAGQSRRVLYAVLSNHRARHLAGLAQAPAALRSAAGVVAILFVLAALLGRTVVSLTTNRFRDIMVAVNRLRSGDLAARTSITGDDELGVLAQSFNEMAHQISEQIDELSERDTKRRELIANIWHDIRTPVADIAVIIDMLQNNESDAQARATMLQSADSSTTMLSHMLVELYELGRLEVGDLKPTLKPTSLVGVIDEVALIFGPKAQAKHIQFIAEAAENLPLVLMDGIMITRVLNNLLENASRYTPAGGEIRIVTEPRDGFIKLSVRDSGSGIDPSELPKIFQREFQGTVSQSVKHGISGLGLAIVKKIIEQHGGEITVASAPGEGTSFSFDLPCSQS